MNRKRAAGRFAGLLVVSGFALGCNEDAVEVTQRSLQSSSELTFVCRGSDRVGLEQTACPDFDAVGTTMLALVTQTATEEVAVVNVSIPGVIDVDPVTPGFSAFRVPSRPGDIVTSPGGAASFVGLTGVGKTGISALPTTCLGAPDHSNPLATVHDVTSFPACRLPSRPGSLAVLVEPPGAEGTRTGCDPSAPLESSVGTPLGADEAITACPADLTAEGGPAGRRKLVVALPDRGELVVIDAQWVVDRELGTFEDCAIEAVLPLHSEIDASGAMQELPPDLDPEGCEPNEPISPPAPPSFLSQPAGFGVGGGRLYVADQGGPIVHVLDASSPCSLTELPPLVALSFEEPARVVTTSRVAVSPLTSEGERFVYALDENDQPASVMAFDVTEGVSNRTPIVRPRSPRVPFEPADRIRFGPPAADIAFALRDLPRESPDQLAQEGVRCDPDPTLCELGDVGCELDLGTLYRPASNYTSGARPGLLRGMFGFIMLTSGQVVVIDVDDFDAPCRRPTRANATEIEDSRGCFGDDVTVPYYTRGIEGEAAPGESPDGSPTVTDEVSCNMVSPHRPRSQSIGVASSTTGVGAPSLKALPRFSSQGTPVPPNPLQRPKILAVDGPPLETGGTPEPPSVYVGTVLYEKDRSGADLPTDPTAEEDMSVTLPLVEPRSYLGADSFSLTYEGRVTPDGTGGFLGPIVSAELPDGAGAGATWSFEDGAAYFCGSGVYDIEMMRDYGENELGLSGSALDNFAETHADYVQVTDGFPVVTDGYWLSERGQDCGGRAACYSAFGRSDLNDLEVSRDLMIFKAFQDRLIVGPRSGVAGDLRDIAEQCTRCDANPDSPDCSTEAGPKEKQTLLWEHCFPGGVRYTVRASNQWVLGSLRSMHDVTARPIPGRTEPPLYECARDCNPKTRLLRSRVFEISSSVDCEAAGCGVGRVTDGSAVCTYDPTVGPPGDQGIKLDDKGASCIFENMVGRFAVYRGLWTSQRGMSFTWQTGGGFSPMLGALTAQSVAVSPQSMSYLPEFESIAIVDASTFGTGLSLMSLDTLSINANWPVY